MDFPTLIGAEQALHQGERSRYAKITGRKRSDLEELKSHLAYVTCETENLDQSGRNSLLTNMLASALKTFLLWNFFFSILTRGVID